MAPILSRVSSDFGFGKRTAAGPSAKATGGTVVTDGGFTYHVFLSPGTFTASQSLPSSFVLIVGGGGGGGEGKGGAGSGGGGGAGGVILHPATIDAGSTTITVGNGGSSRPEAPGTAHPPSPVYSGESSSFSPDLIAYGGGAGGGWGAKEGRSGASGGGSSDGAHIGTGNRQQNTGTDGNPFTASPILPPHYPPQGANGGQGNGGSVGRGGGGGGGASPAIGASPWPSTNAGGQGGDGRAIPQFPAPAISPAIPAPIRPTWTPAVGPLGYYGGGGGGGTSPSYNGGTGGSGGGAQGSNDPSPNGRPGVDYTGGGGGGGYLAPVLGGGGAGGKGIVIVRYPT